MDDTIKLLYLKSNVYLYILQNIIIYKKKLYIKYQVTNKLYNIIII